MKGDSDLFSMALILGLGWMIVILAVVIGRMLVLLWRCL